MTQIAQTRSRIKKGASLFLAFILAMGVNLSAMSSPASAATSPSPNAGKSFTLRVGESFSLDLACQSTDGWTVTQTNYKTGEIPPGMTWTNPGILAGAPTTVGVYSFGDWDCLSVEGMSSGGPSYMTTINVVSDSSLEAVILATSLNDANCSVRLRGLMPLGADPRTAKIEMTNSAGTSTLTLRNYNPDQLFDFTLSMKNLMLSSITNPAITFFTGDPAANNMCKTQVRFDLIYFHAGEGPITATTTAFVTQDENSYEGDLWIRQVYDSECTVHFTGAVPRATDDNLFKIVITGSIGGWDIFFKNVTPDNPLDLVFDYSSVDVLENNPNIERVLVWGEPFDCGDAYFQSGLYYNGNGVGVNIRSSVTNVSRCEAGSYGVIGQEFGMQYRDCVNAEPGFYVPESNMLANQLPCEPGTFAPMARSTTCLPALAGSFVSGYRSIAYELCPLGTYATVSGLAKCTDAPKGSYVPSRGATKATKCPRGLTTELTGSRSINDCYKQKFQTAKAIKPPTKMKFGAKHETAGRADAGLNLNAVAVGSCTVSKIMKTVKIRGKSVKQPRWIIKAGSKAGNCKITLSNAGDYTFKPFTVSKTIKVSKTGK